MGHPHPPSVVPKKRCCHVFRNDFGLYFQSQMFIFTRNDDDPGSVFVWLLAQAAACDRAGPSPVPLPVV